jgi:protein-disulfide isomerase
LAKRKRKRQTQGTTRRPSRRRRQQRSGLRTYGLIAAMVIVAVVVIAILVVLTRGRSPAPTTAQLEGESMGAADAPVVVVEYADYQCPYCRQFAMGAEQQLVTDYVDTGKVRFIFRNFAFIGNESFLAAEAAQCAADQGQFWAYHDLLFDKQGAENSGVFSASNLKDYAASLGLDTTRFNQCLNSGRYLSLVRQQSSQAQQTGISSTPTLMVNGQVVQNGSSYPTLQAAIEAALKGQ